MNLNQDLPNIQMVVSAPYIRHNWWKNIRRIHGAEIRGHLGALLALLGTQCDKVFVTQLMGFWEPSTVTFKFPKFEISPTLEEFNSLTQLPIRGRLPMIPSTICNGDFLSLLNLHIFRLAGTDKKSASRVGIHYQFGNRRGKMVHTRVLCLAEYCESYGSSKHTRALGVCRKSTDWIRESVLPRMGFNTSMYNQIIPRSIDHLIQVVEEEEDPKEDLEEDPEENLEEDPEEEVEEDHMEVFEMVSNIYDPRDEG
ncbi:hypothetical protein H5410_036445 [Solanum commersonii]|uniref:DUF7745 domain-containing protein n=1 Tax=Solanum commersonii TaxID=4109 RepID=A0A9J5Y4U2_SOLCO|nr:hypothetical protein H5410_036445 [Solanum commersonii]